MILWDDDDWEAAMASLDGTAKAPLLEVVGDMKDVKHLVLWHPWDLPPPTRPSRGWQKGDLLLIPAVVRDLKALTLLPPLAKPQTWVQGAKHFDPGYVLYEPDTPAGSPARVPMRADIDRAFRSLTIHRMPTTKPDVPAQVQVFLAFGYDAADSLALSLIVAPA